MKIVTLNLANYDDHPHRDIKRVAIAKDIGHMQPDVCLLREVRFDQQKSSKNMLEQLCTLVMDMFK